MYGFYRIASICPKMKVADTVYNTEEILRCAKIAEAEGASFALFPELSLTGYTCGDLFHQKVLLDGALEGVRRIAEEFAGSPMVLAVGLPLRIGPKLYNCAAILQNGKIKGITPKSYLPDQREFYEKRHFASGRGILKHAPALPCPAPVSNFFTVNDELTVGVELCEDLWCPTPPSGMLAASGANLILNLSASNALIAKSQYRRELVTGQSARCMAVYAYASCGVNESTTDTVFGGHLLIAENGTLLAENKRFQRDSEIIYADVDAVRLIHQRIAEGSFQDYSEAETPCPVPLDDVPGISALKYRKVTSAPFVPENRENRSAVCREIFSIQCAGLAKRMKVTGSKKAVLGLSGGLDSTLALLVAAETFRLLGRNNSDILTLTMPGFGTTDRTRGNAEKMAEELGAELRTVDIRAACLQHFQDIGHDPADLSVTYENVQARERTQILMDTANREHGLVIGTGDLSEIALGWSTYNADHMSMYAVNCGIPKTLVRHIVLWYAEETGGVLGDVLKDVTETPVSPELLPADKTGKIAQKTESILGAYELHDFYLYHFFKYGAEPEKLLYLAEYSFGGKYEESEYLRTLQLFFRRFFTQQFKRSCIPDGPKVGSVSLSPRADWRMPSDASAADWLSRMDKLQERMN